MGKWKEGPPGRVERQTVSAPLSKEERAALRSAERRIAKGWDIFVEVGKALATIRDERLYRETHKSFQAYTTDKWNYGRAYAHRLIGAAETVEDLTPIGVKTLPANEAQVRPLLSLPRERRPEVWRKILEEAGEEKLTARLVSQVARELQDGSPAKKTRRKKRTQVASWMKVYEALGASKEAAASVEDGGVVLSSIETLRKTLEKVVPRDVRAKIQA